MVKNSWRNQRRGAFTLIEILVVCFIIGVLVTMMMASYIRFNQKRKVEVAALSFASLLRTQQKRANSGDVSECGFGVTFGGYKVMVETTENPTVAKYTALCQGANSHNYTLENKTHFTDDLDVSFLPLSQGAMINSGSGETTVTNKKYSYQIAIDQHGMILVQAL